MNTDKPKNPAAQALGSMARGIPKTFTPADLELRKLRLAAGRAKRWAGHVKSSPASWASLKQDPRVSEAWSEQGSGDGYWVTLKDGWADLVDDPHSPTHTLHEWSIKAILLRMRHQVRVCACKDCTEALKKGKL